MKRLKFHTLVILAVIVGSTFLFQGCAVMTQATGDECIEVLNYISPEYELRTKTGYSIKTKTVDYQEGGTFWVPTDDSRRISIHLSVMVVDKRDNVTVNSVKQNVTWRTRTNHVGCVLVQISNHNFESFDIQ